MNRYAVLCLLLLIDVLVVPFVNGAPTNREKRISGATMAKGAVIGGSLGLLGVAAAAGIKKFADSRKAAAAAPAAGAGDAANLKKGRK